MEKRDQNLNSKSVSAQTYGVLSSYNPVIFKSYILGSTSQFEYLVIWFYGQSPSSVKVSASIFSATTRDGVYSREGDASGTLKLINDSISAVMLPSTKYVKGSFNASTYSGSTPLVSVYPGYDDAKLFNRKGVEYPSY